MSTKHFYLFFALGLVETYRDIILDRLNNQIAITQIIIALGRKELAYRGMLGKSQN